MATRQIRRITDIPADYPGLSGRQRATVEVMRSGVPVYDQALAAVLGQLRYPAHFLDFETTAFGLPHFAGTRPWQVSRCRPRRMLRAS